jgi:hypothetical protein
MRRTEPEPGPVEPFLPAEPVPEEVATETPLRTLREMLADAMERTNPREVTDESDEGDRPCGSTTT